MNNTGNWRLDAKVSMPEHCDHTRLGWLSSGMMPGVLYYLPDLFCPVFKNLVPALVDMDLLFSKNFNQNGFSSVRSVFPF
jgi:hypothetical protein